MNLRFAKIRMGIQLSLDYVCNASKSLKMLYIIEHSNWVIESDGYFIKKNLKPYLRSRTSFVTPGLHNKIIHFGSEYTYMVKDRFGKLHPSNKKIISWFHVVPNNNIELIKQLNNEVDFVHTACYETRDRLMENGLRRDKIVVIPLGIDTNIFVPYDKSGKAKIKKLLGLPDDKFIIGSFQKDGVGWGEGLTPKLIKGPDVFCSTVEKLSKLLPVHILLTGPARGYIKKRLDAAQISYTHCYLKNYLDIVDYYNALDLYIIASRIEGGPKALIESWATGVPVVSTRVGMAKDYIEQYKNGILVEKEDSDGLANAAKEILTDEKLRFSIIEKAKIDCQNFDWKFIAKEYYNKLYKPLL